MNRRRSVSIVSAAVVVCALSLSAAPARAQVDLTGQWAALNQSEARTRIPGPDLGDFVNLPLNDEGRAVGLSYSYSMISMPDRMCMDWSENYITFAPHDISIQRVDDPVNGGILAWRISAGGSDRAPIPIWLDGRERPSENDLHTFAGFTTGKWEGGILTGRMTHMARGLSARNGAPLSDQATMTIHVVRHGDRLTIMTITEDPIYLAAPFVQAGSYTLNPVGDILPVNPPCYPLTELARLDVPGTVPHFIPGTNRQADDFAKKHNLPLETALGGTEQIYPEYRKRLKAGYKIPPPCKITDPFLLDCNPVP